MKTNKILTLLTIACLAALSAGCQKAETEKPVTMTLRATLTTPADASTPGTRLILGDDRLTCKWTGDETIYLLRDASDWYLADFRFTVSSVSPDGRTAQFTYQPDHPDFPTPIPAGSYRVSGLSSDGYESGDHALYFGDPYTQTDQYGRGVLGNAFIGVQRVTVTEGEADLGDVELVSAGALLEIPVKNSTGSPVVVDSLNMGLDQPILDQLLWHQDGRFENSGSSTSGGVITKIKDPNNTIADGETYRVYLVVAPQTISSDVMFKVVTDDKKEVYSFTKPGKTLEAGLRYTVTGIDLVTPDPK